MKRLLILVLALICVSGLVGCNNRSMNNIIEHESSISGIVEEVSDDFIIIYIEAPGYPNGASCMVSLDVENKDSYTDVSIGDEIVVYYNGDIAESYPLKIDTIYAMTLRTPVNQRKE